MRRCAFALIAFVALAAVVVHAATIKEVTIAAGRDDFNKITAPLFAASARPLAIGTFQAAFDRKAKIVRRGTSGMFTRGPEYDLDKAVDLAALYAEALRAEAPAMGFTVSTAADAWQISGSVKDIYLESKQIPYGATLFYGYMDVDLQIASGSAAPESRRMRFHTYFGAYNAGMGRKDEATDALARLLVDSAQETISRLNRQYFKSAPHQGMAARLQALRSSGVMGHENDLNAVGLSGTPGAGEALLAMLPQEKDEGRRSAIIEALGRLGSADAMTLLTSRYAAEDEDCRWATIKAMDAIGTAEALAFVKDQGAKDKDVGPKRLAQRITAAR